MNEQCPHCNHTFEQEPGYFLGAMYISYPISVAVMGLFWWLLILLFPRLPLTPGVFISAALFLPLVPLTFRYSRVLWLHFDPPHVDDI